MTVPFTPSFDDVFALLPVIIVTGGAFAVLMVAAFVSKQHKNWVKACSIAVLALAWAVNSATFGLHVVVFDGMFVRDGVSNLLAAVILLITAVGLIYGWNDHPARQFRAEVPVLFLFACVGMLCLVSAGSLLMAYLGLELLALCSYALVASRRDSAVCAEAAMKYFVLGSLASGLLLYGMSLIYGTTQQLNFGAIAQTISTLHDTTLLQLGVIFTIAGVAFKLGAAPFHMYLPDVYQGAPSSIALFVSAAPKLAAYGLVYRLFWIGLGHFSQWHGYIVALSAVSLVVGNVMALMQIDFKRMLAYSTVSHCGFMLLAVACGDPFGFSSGLFYAIVYAIMSTGVFGAIILSSQCGSEGVQIRDFQGLGQRDPWLAASFLCLMLSMTGVPPFLGFWAKYAVITAALRKGLIGLAGLGLVSAVIGAWYYLRIVQFMYFYPSTDRALTSDRAPWRNWLLRFHALSLIGFGLACQGLITWCQRALAL